MILWILRGRRNAKGDGLGATEHADIKGKVATAGGGKLGIWVSWKHISSVASTETISKVKVYKWKSREERNGRK